jgi:3-deoxy-D-manno-octulosonic-acid transferase
MESFLLDLAYLFFFGLWSPWVLYKMATTGKYRAGLKERFGSVPLRAGARHRRAHLVEGRGERPCLWVHGVSVGEVASARTLIEAFARRFPDWEVVVSTTTATGQQTARRLYRAPVFYYPLDFSFAVRRALARIRPSLVCLLELEMWPNFLRLCQERGVPVVLVNGVLSDWSYKLHKRFWPFLRGTYGRIRTFAVQTERYAARLRELGVPAEKVVVTGNMKHDTIDTSPAPPPAGLREELTLQSGDLVLVAGSTHPGEEEALLTAYTRLRERFGRLRLVIAPRHPERFGEVAALIRGRGLALHRRTGKPTAAGGSEPPVILVDTLGELTTIYRFADVVFVGGTLVPIGGHNVMEPAGLGKMPIVGPHTAKAAEGVDLLLARRAAVQVADAEQLARVLAEFLAEPDRLREAGERARQVVLANQGATGRNLELLAALVAERTGAGRSASCTLTPPSPNGRGKV